MIRDIRTEVLQDRCQTIYIYIRIMAGNETMPAKDSDKDNGGITIMRTVGIMGERA